MDSSWQEVKRLAADFQRAQLGSIQQRLSERNCVEIVTKLIAKQLIHVIFTTDGKEYVTPEHVLTEIKNELIVCGGRIHLGELADTLRLDYKHIEARSSELVSNERDIVLSLGQLIDKNYLDRICEEINNKLQQGGVIVVSDCASHYDLSPPFFHEMVHKRIGSIICGEPDPLDSNVIFNEAYKDEHKRRIRGSLLAAIKPVLVNNIIVRYGLLERLFFMALDQLISSGQLQGTISGGRNSKMSSYIPRVYTAAKHDVIASFYNQNNCLDYGVIRRMDVGDPREYIRSHYENEKLMYLKTCAINDYLLNQIVSNIEDELGNNLWTDVTNGCPSFFMDADIQMAMPTIISRSKALQQMEVFCKTLLVNSTVAKNALLLFNEALKAKAEEVVQLGLVGWGGKLYEPSDTHAEKAASDSKRDRKEERRKKAAAGGKSGGGTQGREVKTKSVKKKHHRGGDDDDDDRGKAGSVSSSAKQELVFLTVKQIEEELRKWDALDEECPEELVTEIAQRLEGPLTDKFRELARSFFQANTAGSTSALKKSHSEICDKVNGLITNVNLFSKGAEQFDADVKSQLHKHLLKTICTDIANQIFTYIAQENMLPVEQQLPLTAEKRAKILQKLPKLLHDVLSKLNAALNGKGLDDFTAALEAAMAPNVCDMIAKKQDKKKEKQIVADHKAMLLQQLGEVTDPALVLHLSVLVLFHTVTQSVLHASGKFVPQILAFLKAHLPQDVYDHLHAFQDLVIRHLTVKDDPVEQETIRTKLAELVPSIKETAIGTKK